MVKWTPKSEHDLEQIMEYVAENFSIELALEIVHEIIDQVESILSANHLAGSIVESNPFFSKLVVNGNSIFYCENPKDRNLYIVYVQPRNSDLKNRGKSAFDDGRN